MKLYSSVNEQDDPVLGFSFQSTVYEVENTIGNTVWLKLVRNDHSATGYYSEDGVSWTQVGDAINISALDQHQNDFNDFTGNQQGPFVEGKEAFFDLYVYRDGYSEIQAKSPANFNGTSRLITSSYLGSISNGDWAMYAGVQLGTRAPSNDGVDYQKEAIQINMNASSGSEGGTVEVWLDAIETGDKIAEVNITNTGSVSEYKIFRAELTEAVSGEHDVYLRFIGEQDGTELFRLKSFFFSTEILVSNEEELSMDNPDDFKLNQNYPNPFNPSTNISYSLPEQSDIRLTVFDALGRSVEVLEEGLKSAGNYSVTWDASNRASGVYFYKLEANGQVFTQKMLLIK